MEWSKIKNIIILLLLLVNGFLLVLVGMRQGQSQRYQSSALTQALQVLEGNGIQVQQQALADARGRSAWSVGREVSREQALAAALLGEEVSVENQGGGVYRYQGQRGWVTLRAGGAVSLTTAQDSRWTTQDPLRHAQGLLEEMGLEGEVLEAGIVQGTGTVCLRQLWQGAPLFSCRLVFTYDQGRLLSMEGSLTAADPAQGEQEPGESLTLPTALLRFLDGILSSGDVCSQIQSMQPGYRVTDQSFSGSVTLHPVWLVTSNTGQYYLDGLTGALTRAEDSASEGAG